MMDRIYRIAPGLLAALLLTTPAAAAPIAWSIGDIDGTNGVGDAAVSTNGTLIEAANFGGDGVPDALVNGVNFVGIDYPGGDSPIHFVGTGYNNSQSGNGASGIGDIDVILNTIGFFSFQNVTTADLAGLVSGRQYEVQFFLSHTNTATRSQAIDDGEGNSITMKNADPSQFVTGTFTADGTTQFVRFDNLSNGSQLLSGYQLRDVTPEPGSLALLGLGALLLSRRRRD